MIWIIYFQMDVFMLTVYQLLKEHEYAILLILEIKRNNEDKITLGKQNNNIYVQLKSEIDRARCLYDNKVKELNDEIHTYWDYLNYELISNLADGDENKLGIEYKDKITEYKDKIIKY